MASGSPAADPAVLARLHARLEAYRSLTLSSHLMEDFGAWMEVTECAERSVVAACGSDL